MIAAYDPLDAAWHFLRWWWLIGGIGIALVILAIIVIGRYS